MKKNLKIIVILFVVLMIFLIFIKLKNDYFTKPVISDKVTNIFQKIDEQNSVDVNKYFIYGTHLNIEGTVKIPKVSGISIYSVHIIAQNSKNDSSIETKYTYKDNILSFSTATEINNGFYLENLLNDDYYVFLKVILSNSDEMYYTLTNKTKYENITYYSLTKNNSNNKIDVKFDTYNNLPTMVISCSKCDSLPNNVYDIAIDASHGGIDTGAKKGKNRESDIVLDCSKILKDYLEKLGYKIFLTRNGSENANENMAINMYDENGRVNIVQAARPKLLISLNINDIKSKKGGVEVFAPSKNITFAKLLADNIVKKAKTSYSEFKTFKEAEGVYVHNFTDTEITSFNSRAKNGNYEPYNITTSTPYLYMIRETGGIATNAFIDGRNKNYGTNKYYNSNYGIESYSIELGYMNIESDLNNILKNKNLYMEGIADSIKEFYK